MTRRSLRGELLFGFAFLTSAAVLVVGASAAILVQLNPSAARWALLALWLGSTAVIVTFGAWLVTRRVLRPLSQLAAQANALAEGRRIEPAAFETADFAHLAERFSWMADRLLDARGQVVQSEKLAAIGQLAAGVAHEVRNPLGALGNYVEVLRRRGGADDVITSMQHEVDRMDRIVRQLLDYARPRTTAPVPALVGPTIERIVDLLRARDPGAAGRIELEIAPGLPAVRMEGHTLEQILINLVLNARDARPGGRIRIGAVGAGGPDARPHRAREVPPWRPDLPAGQAGVILFVADEGPGVAPADRERIFDPFFTTKPAGEGTGLGLALAARAVHDAGGAIWVDEGQEGGAVFRVFVPSVEGT